MVAWGLPACVGVAVAFSNFVPVGAGRRTWLMWQCIQVVRAFGLKLVRHKLDYRYDCLGYVSDFLQIVCCVGCANCTQKCMFLKIEK